jgi:hypothetical protein
MPDKELAGADKTEKKEGIEVTFRCQCCNCIRPLKEMRSVTRFLPVLIVCRECEKALR